MNTLGQLLALLTQPAQQPQADDFSQWLMPKPQTPAYGGGKSNGMNGIGSALASGLGIGGAGAGAGGAGMLAGL